MSHLAENSLFFDIKEILVEIEEYFSWPHKLETVRLNRELTDNKRSKVSSQLYNTNKFLQNEILY